MNNLVYEYNNIYQNSVCKKTVDANCSVFAKEIETNPKAPKFKIADRFTLTKYKSIFSEGYAENWLKGIFGINSVIKTNPWAH